MSNSSNKFPCFKPMQERIGTRCLFSTICFAWKKNGWYFRNGITPILIGAFLSDGRGGITIETGQDHMIIGFPQNSSVFPKDALPGESRAESGRQ